MILGKDLKEQVERMLSEKFEKPLRILDASSVGGGSINECYQIGTGLQNFFIKVNDAEKFPGMFESEEKGLKLLAKNSAFKVPDVISLSSEKHSILILEYIAKASATLDHSVNAGRLLAEMHKHSNSSFGLDHDNYIGSLHQSNKQHNDWCSFIIEERFERQLRLAKDHDRIDTTIMKRFDKLFARLEEIFPKEKPSLLHGDLWSGNIMASNEGPCIYDPAAYYGHREMDLAMTKLFGGFDPEFYRSYREHFPLEKGWEQRIEICNLYPLMVHVNLFGGSYLHDVAGILKRFSSILIPPLSADMLFRSMYHRHCYTSLQ